MDMNSVNATHLKAVGKKRGVRLLQEGGKTILPTETLSNTMDGLSNYACSWTSSRRSRQPTELLKENDFDTEITSH